ncbi:MAG: dihydrofolate reductase [Cytophagales bacterium]
MKVSIIVAISNNNAIGKNNQLLWHLPNDLKMFKSITTGHCIIMGRKTYESIGKPLPNRTNILISNQKDFKIEGCELVNSIEEALEKASQKGESEVFVIGGGQIYGAAMALADRIYLTKVNVNIEGDVYFPDLTISNWHVVSSELHIADEKHAYEYTFEILERVK